MIAQLNENEVLSQSTLQMMSDAESFNHGIGVYGLGPHLYSQDHTDSKMIGHDGSGNDAISSAARIDLMSKDGIIVLETGNYNIASVIADEWIFWKTGIANYVVMQRNIPFLMTLLIIGYVIIIGLSIFIIKRRNRNVVSANID